MDGVAERPAKNSVDSYVVAKGNGEVNRGTIDERAGKDVSNNSAEEAMKISGGEGGGITSGTGEANGFKGVGGIIEFDEGVSAVGKGGGEVAVVGVQAAV